MSKTIQNVSALETPTDLERDGVEEICEELRRMLADVFGH